MEFRDTHAAMICSAQLAIWWADKGRIKTGMDRAGSLDSWMKLVVRWRRGPCARRPENHPFHLHSLPFHPQEFLQPPFSSTATPCLTPAAFFQMGFSLSPECDETSSWAFLPPLTAQRPHLSSLPRPAEHYG